MRALVTTLVLVLLIGCAAPDHAAAPVAPAASVSAESTDDTLDRAARAEAAELPPPPPDAAAPQPPNEPAPPATNRAVAPEVRETPRIEPHATPAAPLPRATAPTRRPEQIDPSTARQAVALVRHSFHAAARAFADGDTERAKALLTDDPVTNALNQLDPDTRDAYVHARVQLLDAFAACESLAHADPAHVDIHQLRNQVVYTLGLRSLDAFALDALDERAAAVAGLAQALIDVELGRHEDATRALQEMFVGLRNCSLDWRGRCQRAARLIAEAITTASAPDSEDSAVPLSGPESPRRESAKPSRASQSRQSDAEEIRQPITSR